MALIGYARVHPRFSLRKQVKLLKQAGCEQIFQDKAPNEYTGFHQAVEAYEEGRDVFVTLLHDQNSILEKHFLAMVELNRLTRGVGRPKKEEEEVNVKKVSLRLLERKIPSDDICYSLGISGSTLFRIKKDNLLA